MKKLSLTMLFAMSALLAFSQTKPDTTGNRLELFFGSADIALPLLYEAAIKHAAEIEGLDAQTQLAEEEVTTAKRQILSGVSVGGGYHWGSRFRYSDSDQMANSWNPFVLPVQTYYNIGVNVGVPLLSIIGRRSEIKKSMLQLKQVQTEKKLTEREIRQEIITLYQELVLSKKVMENAQNAYQSAELSRQIAEKRFRQGELKIDEQMQVIDYYNKASLALEQAKSTYITNYLLLEERLGTTVYNLMNQGK